MSSLRISLNGVELVHAGTGACCSLSWDVVCSRLDETFAYLMVSGKVERGDGIYDHLHWLEGHPLKAGDRLAIECVAGEGSSPFVNVQTHEQLQDLRGELTPAPDTGYGDAEHAAPRRPLRSSCRVELQTADGSLRKVTAVGEVTTVLCHGIWSRDHRPQDWRLRIAGVPGPAKSPGFWQPISGAVQVAIRI